MLKIVPSSSRRRALPAKPREQTAAPQPTESARRDFLHNLGEMIDLLSAKVQKDRNALDDYILLGRLFRLRGEPRRALRLHRNLSARPSLERRHEAALYRELGFDLLECGAKDFGEAYFLKALSLQRNDPATLGGLARSYEMQSRYDKAADVLARLVKLGHPEKTRLAYVLSALALRHLENGAVAKARRAVEKAIRADETCPYARLTLVDVYTAAQRYERAIDTLRDFLREYPSHSFLALRRLEDVHYRMNNFPALEDTLKNCIHLSPDNFYLHYSLARHLKKKKRDVESLEHLVRCLKEEPSYVNGVRDFIRLTARGDSAPDIISAADRFFAALKQSRKFICPNCKHPHTPVTWRCIECGTWGTFEVRYELPAP